MRFFFVLCCWRLSLRSLFIRFQLLFRFVCETPRGSCLPNQYTTLLLLLSHSAWAKGIQIHIQFVYQQEIEWVSPNESSSSGRRGRETGEEGTARVARWVAAQMGQWAATLAKGDDKRMRMANWIYSGTEKEGEWKEREREGRDGEGRHCQWDAVAVISCINFPHWQSIF